MEIIKQYILENDETMCRLDIFPNICMSEKYILHPLFILAMWLSEATIGILQDMPKDGDVVDPAGVDVCGTLPENTTSGAWYEVECRKTGPVVIIQHQNKYGILSICEIEVYEHGKLYESENL